MQIDLPALALGMILAWANPFAAAAPTVTISQLGSGNTAAAAQSGVAAGGAVANVSQTGTGNHAGIVQGNVDLLVPTVTVTQAGSSNSATVRQTNSSVSNIVVKQNGAGNATDVVQSAAVNAGIPVTQAGTGNRATVVEQGTGFFAGPAIEQNGEGNTVSATATDNSFSYHTIVQTGLRNDALTHQANALTSTLSIRQLGANNLASIAQDGLPGTSTGNTALITQVGHANHASLRQDGSGFASTLSQIGAGNDANVYQH